jgi:exopolyphosphatase / guanosine-5'-triphosphate,3'-diphosphate pyrophosphatase
MPRYAAIDIGSNSIRMEASDVAPGGETTILASDRQVTRLGESVFRNGAISEEAAAFVCSVLERMAAQCRTLNVSAARAVATAAVRDARNQSEFIQRASQAARIPVEIITGREESRLIHLGVQSRWPHPEKRILVVDIGGGSAEMILGDRGVMRDAISKPLGAVRLHEIFLHDDPPSKLQLNEMWEYIDQRLSGSAKRFGVRQWDRVVATSATASAVVCAVNGIPRARRDEADRKRASTAQLRKLCARLSGMPLAERRKVAGIGARRAEIIVPGAATLLRIMEAFGAPSIYYSTAGVRDGIIADLANRGVGRELSELNRDQRREVERIATKFAVPLRHARCVARFGSQLFSRLQGLHGLSPEYGRLMEAATYLYDVGHYVNDASHHKHSYYLVMNSDLPAFTAQERQFVANLCRYHRKALPSPSHAGLESLSAEQERALPMLIPLLRLADALDRSHEQRVSAIDLGIEAGRVTLGIGGAGDLDLEHWAAERVEDLFKATYGATLVVTRLRATRPASPASGG